MQEFLAGDVNYTNLTFNIHIHLRLLLEPVLKVCHMIDDPTIFCTRPLISDKNLFLFRLHRSSMKLRLMVLTLWCVNTDDIFSGGKS